MLFKLVIFSTFILVSEWRECRADSLGLAEQKREQSQQVNNPFHHDVMWWDMKNGSEVSRMSLRALPNAALSLVLPPKYKSQFVHNFFGLIQFSYSSQPISWTWPAVLRELKARSVRVESEVLKWNLLPEFLKFNWTLFSTVTSSSRFSICCATQRKTRRLSIVMHATDASFVLAFWRRVSWIKLHTRVGKSNQTAEQLACFNLLFSHDMFDLIICSEKLSQIFSSVFFLSLHTTQAERCWISSHSAPIFT